MSGKQSLDMTMEYYLRIPMKMVTQVGFSTLFEKKQEEVDLNKVDEIEYSDKDKKTRHVNLKVVGTPDDFKVSLGVGVRCAASTATAAPARRRRVPGRTPIRRRRARWCLRRGRT